MSGGSKISVIVGADATVAPERRNTRLKPIAAVLALCTAQGLAAEDVSTLEEVQVTAAEQAQLGAATFVLGPEEIAPKRARTSDTAEMLTSLPGVSVYGAGGVSSLPAIRGLADDRLRIKVDGMDLNSSCPNHMNAPLSYIDPTAVENVRVYSGVTPVSVGGDSMLFAGAGIVADSIPAREWRETELKFRPLAEALGGVSFNGRAKS
jgi:iron complex outermembrane receptor protein